MSTLKPPSELRQAVMSLRPYFVRAAWFSIFSSLLGLAPSGYMLEVYDRVVNSRSHLTLVMLTLVVLGAYMLMEVLEWARAEIMHEAGLKLDEQMRNRVFSAIFEANLKRIPGGSLQPLNDFRTLRDFLGSPPLLALMEAPVSLVFLALVFAISPVLGWSAIVGSMLQVFIGWLNERNTQPPLVAANRSAIAAQQYADGSLRNAQVIESMGMLRDIHRRWMDKQREFLGLQAIASDRAGGYQALTKFLQTTMGSLLLGLGAWLLLHNQLNGGAGMMIIGSLLGGKVLAPLVQIVTQWRTVVNVRDAWQRLEGLLATVPAKQETMPLPAPRGLLQVEALVASAPNGGVAIIKNVAFSLPPGEVLAVVGPSASGKTTLARLLIGLWPAASGKVRLDGADVFTWDKSELGPHLGYLPQGVELLEGTLAENIARFGEVEPAKVKAAARAVGLHDFIMSLPQGYESPIGREGAMLSGGQRQRVALARAIYGDPVLVVLDEPNSSLDEAGDAALAAAILELKTRGTTFVIMTHRTSVLAVADKMLVLRDGVMQAFGPRNDVLAALRQASEQAAAAPPASPAPPGTLVPAA
ncbi:ATP-binding cassette, subfamily C, exporter for protease/lipase [Polaromonas sp. OV174]|uniref:type I secretion system permease/ATPase n=1 Tax=Polaromonas sp. OV174 TaxID=1855300 RepID=UPI0008E61827|nr:type I secretion system permease/ATPase [Polaromonas sp. OV174]SFC17106.1 ATP-binding cassette, subfamily C, exporter for protease/lipase [Polaromonas sp. OV174]